MSALSDEHSDQCEEPERCYKCLRRANAVMQAGAQKLIDENASLRRRLRELQDAHERCLPQIRHMGKRIYELESRISP